MLCKAPFVGLTIDPSGQIIMCCATGDRQQFNAKITDVEDLTEFFRGKQYEHLRSKMTSEGINGIKECWKCAEAVKKGAMEEIYNYDRYTPSDDLNIRYLEVTTSNVCNQTCAMCSSYFSTKWRKIESQFPHWAYDKHQTFALSDESIEKILRVIPNLGHLNIKGGEPFADKNNLKILTKVAETNPKCEVIITSNFQNIPEEWFEPLSKLENLIIGASVDGTGKTYDWIRGGDFENTYFNILEFQQKLNVRVNINMCISLYNIFNLRKTQEMFDGYVQNFYNVVISPQYLSPALIDTHKLKEILLAQYGDNSDNISKNLWNITQTSEPWRSELIKRFFLYTESMNKVRGFDIFEIHPELADIFK